MSQRRAFFQRSCDVTRRHVVTLTVCLLFSGVAAAQDSPSMTSDQPSSVPVAIRVPLGIALQPGVSASVRRMTLGQAQQLAAVAGDPLVRLGQLQVDAAEQHRLGVKALYFPNVSGQFSDLHFDRRPGEVLSAPRPILGETLSVPVNIITQDSIAVNVSVAQPITPLFQVRQLVKIARADETIARAKAGMPAKERASLVEKAYFDLLVAERELVSVRAQVRRIQVSAEQQPVAIGAARSWLLATGKVKELTASLNELLGLPSETGLELVPPDFLVEHLSLADVVAQAAASADVVEAEQTAVKAHAASALAKMEYVPTIAVIGGYAHQTAINVVLPEDFSYIGVMASYTLFDSGKRERGVKERAAQVAAADLAVQVNKEKALAAVRSSYFELERSRELVQFARRLVSAPRVIEASEVADDQNVDPAQLQMEAELLRAELEHRQAYARVKALMGR